MSDILLDVIQQKLGVKPPNLPETKNKWLRFGKGKECYLIQNDFGYAFGNKRTGDKFFEVTNDDKNTDWNVKYHELPTATSHIYLDRKKILPHGIKLDDRGDLVVPIYIRDRISSVQKILKKKTKEGNDKFIFGPKQSGYFPFGSFDNPTKIYIAEGFATAATIFECTGTPTICAFDAGNLLAVGEVIREKYPQAQIVFCADNDSIKGHRVGEVRAKQAAFAIKASVCLPTFKDTTTKPSDFNDLFILEGKDAVLAQLQNTTQVDVPKDTPSQDDGIYQHDKSIFDGNIKFLGYNNEGHWFLSRQFLIPKKIAKLSTDDLTDLMPFNFWYKHFEGERGTSIDLNRAADALKKFSFEAGAIDKKVLFGAGFYFDGEKFFINDGKKIFFPHTGEEQDLFSFKDKLGRDFFADGSFLIPAKNRREDFDLLLEKVVVNLEKIAWKDSRSAQLILGWAFCANVAGALPWRPHIWITGSSTSGKSYIKDNFLSKTIPNHITVGGKTTEAGIRSKIKSKSLAVLMDEMETTGTYSAHRIAQIVDLTRNASGDSSCVVVKSTPSGEDRVSLARFCASLCSINSGIVFEQDDNRFLILEIERNEKLSKEFMENGTDHFFKIELTKDFGIDFFSFCVEKMQNDFFPIHNQIHEILRKRKTARFADTYSPVLAGYAVCINIKQHQIQSWLEQNLYFEPFEKQTETNEVACLEHLLSSTFNDNGKQISIETAIQKTCLPEGYIEWEDRLNNFGIKKTKVLHISRASAPIEKIFSGTQWEKNWPHALKKLPGSKLSTIWNGQRVVNTVAVGLENIFKQREIGENDE
jgi:hypothetical protein